MKCSAVCRNGVWQDVFKDPITDKGKTSKKGRVALFRDKDGNFVSVDPQKENTHDLDFMLQLRYADGQIMNEVSFEEVRANAKI